MQNKEVKLDKPIAVGQAILDLSKVAMYNFLYDVMKVKYGEKVRVCYSDTDSLILQIKTADLYRDMREPEMMKHFDFSEYPMSHPNYSVANKKVPQKMKDEMKRTLMEVFCALRSKVYVGLAPSKDDQVYDKQACKGVHMFEIKNTKFKNYMQCLFGETKQDVVQQYESTSIDSTKHIVTNTKSTKIKLSLFEDKRYYISRCSSVAHGHW